MHKRNVVVLGKTGAGKSTIANKIIEARESDDGDTDQFEVSHSVLDSVTASTNAKASLLTTSDNTLYVVQVIDTIGLFDNKSGMTNEGIMKDVKTFFKERVPEGLSLILFVFRQGRWTKEEQKTFDLFTKHFVDTEVSTISALVVTGCDGFTDERKQQVKDEFQQAHSNVYDFMKKGVYTVSFQDTSKLIPEIQSIHKQYQKHDQDMLRKLIFDCGDEMKLSKEIVQDTYWEKINVSLCQIL